MHSLGTHDNFRSLQGDSLNAVDSWTVNARHNRSSFAKMKGKQTRYTVWALASWDVNRKMIVTDARLILRSEGFVHYTVQVFILQGDENSIPRLR